MSDYITDIEEEYERTQKAYQAAKRKWEGTEYLKDVPVAYAALIAQILENQSAYMDREAEAVFSKSEQKFFLRVVSRVYQKHLEDGFMSIQPMCTPNSVFFFMDSGSKMCRIPVASSSRKLKVKYTLNPYREIVAHHPNAEQQEEEVTNIFVEQFYLDQRMEFLRDVRNSEEQIQCNEKSMQSVVQVVLGSKRDTDFLITSPEIACRLDVEGFGIKVHTEPFFETNRILLGSKEQGLAKGYAHGPYIAAIRTPMFYDPENFTPRRTLITRYGKRLLEGKRYTNIKIQDLKV